MALGSDNVFHVFTKQQIDAATPMPLCGANIAVTHRQDAAPGARVCEVCKRKANGGVIPAIGPL